LAPSSGEIPSSEPGTAPPPSCKQWWRFTPAK